MLYTHRWRGINAGRPLVANRRTSIASLDGWLARLVSPRRRRMSVLIRQETAFEFLILLLQNSNLSFQFAHTLTPGNHVGFKGEVLLAFFGLLNTYRSMPCVTSSAGLPGSLHAFSPESRRFPASRP